MAKHQKGYVYFIEAIGAEVAKIGFTWGDVRSRLSVIQVHNHCRLRLLGVMRNRSRLEAAIHMRFKHLRVRGEWFRLEKDLIEFIETNRITGTRCTIKRYLGRA